MPALPRGFKTRANRLALQAREWLRVAAHAPLCPWKLASHLNVPMLPLSALAADSEETARAAAHLMKVDRRAFSAGTFRLGAKCLLIFNDANPVPRQASDVAHELAHVLLKHPPVTTFDETGCRQYDRGQEAEAEWLGPALLVSEEAALHIARQSWTVQEASVQYGVTEEVARFRLNVTAAHRRVA